MAYATTTFGAGAWSGPAAPELTEPVEGVDWQLLVHRRGTDVPSGDSVDFVVSGDRIADPPSGLGSQSLDLLEGKLVSQPYSLRLADPAGELTARFFGGGRLRILGRWAEVRRRENLSPWERVDLRRISTASSPNRVTWDLELATDSSLLRELLFERSSDIQLYPLGPTRDWHRHPAAGLTDPTAAGNPGEILDVDGDLVQVRLEDQSVPAEIVDVVRDQFEGLRLEAGGEDREVVSFGPVDPFDLDEAVGTWEGSPGRMPESVWVDWPGHAFTGGGGESAGALRLYWPDGVPTSPGTPVLVGPVIDPLSGEVAGSGYRLDDVVRDVLRGGVGGRRMPFDDDALEALAELGDEGHWFVVEGPISRGEFLRQYVWRPHVIAAQMRPTGDLAPVEVWGGDAVSTSGLYRFDADNVAGDVHYAAGGAEIANEWRLRTRRADRRLRAPAVLPLLDLTGVPRVRRADDRSVEEPYELDLGAQIMRREWLEALSDLFSERVFGLAGDGAGIYRFAAAVAADSPQPGDLAVLEMDDLGGPAAQSASRSGDRVVIVIERTRSYGTAELRYDYLVWDAGWRAHSTSHADTGHADTHSDSGAEGHFDAHLDLHLDVHQDAEHGDQHFDGSHVDTHGDDDTHSDSHDDAGHQDAHGDEAHEDSHDDIQHNDSDHTDLHTDQAHLDGHDDVAHSDNHVDGDHLDSHDDALGYLEPEPEGEDIHCDVLLTSGTECFHGDSHGDADHGDSHSDSAHQDGHGDGGHVDFHSDHSHGDVEHDDSHADTHSDSHGDAEHLDAHEDAEHGDTHSDTVHSDAHDDLGHADEHRDSEHWDGHADGTHGDEHQDLEHSDWHADGGHQDDHDDAGHTDLHGDAGHADLHDDVSHVDLHDDTAHQDAHEDVEHVDDHADDDDAHDDSHSDNPHSDSPAEHSDIHQDFPHEDSHDDAAHADDHDDVAHTDDHEDVDIHDDHGDVSGKAESGGPHIDQTEPGPPLDHCDTELAVGDDCHVDWHSDIAEHTDTHDDVSHTDIHDDTGHADQHTDGAHDDSHDDAHGDGGHQDSPHNDAHFDGTTHADDHDDAGHQDSHDDGAHEDSHDDTAHDDSHDDGGHQDSHTDSEHTDIHQDEDHDDAHRDQDHSDVHADLEN